MPQTAPVKKLKSLGRRVRFLKKAYNGWWKWSQFLNITSAKDFINLFKNPGELKLFAAVKPYTMVTWPRLAALYNLASGLEKAGVKGSFVECGVRNGGSAGVIGAAAHRDAGRHVWLYDSWEGFPETGEIDVSYNEEQAQRGEYIGYEQRVKELLFNRLRLDSARVHLVKGWFSDTVNGEGMGDIALVHLDCDLYESVKYCLEQLYDRVVPGGYIVIDDYGYWKGCKQAVDEFIAHRSLKIEMVRVDAQGVYFRKETA